MIEFSTTVFGLLVTFVGSVLTALVSANVYQYAEAKRLNKLIFAIQKEQNELLKAMIEGGDDV